MSSGIAAIVLFAEQKMALVVSGRYRPLELLPFALAYCVALRPQSVFLFLTFWATFVWSLVLGFPENNTNQTLSFFVGLAILGSAGSLMLRARSVRMSSSALVDSFSPVVRLCLIALYLWTIFHKLNSDFLNPDVSCAARLTDGMFRRLASHQLPPALAQAAVFMTVAVEASFPIGLMFQRTQRLTAFVALGFHWMLALAGFSGFSATMMTLLTLFLPDADVRRILPRKSAVPVLVGTVVALLLIATIGRGDPMRVLKLVWLVLTPLAGLSWWLNRRNAAPDGRPAATWRLILQPRPLYVVPFLLFLNGASPYLGFKTEYSYAMYSNLRTEDGRTNHLIWRTPLSLAGYQTDLVRVLDGSDPVILDRLGGRPVTRYQLTSLLWKIVHEQGRTNVPVIIDVKGVRQEYPAADRSPLLVEPTFLERHLLRFRNIVPPSAENCAH